MMRPFYYILKYFYFFVSSFSKIQLAFDNTLFSKLSSVRRLNFPMLNIVAKLNNLSTGAEEGNRVFNFKNADLIMGYACQIDKSIFRSSQKR